ncbi:putative membrane protein [Rhodoblastus acidophilus]|uniref:DUF1345 domain-containing protein n=1 Tax=Rhodoblastus acidophilus TaxID=1074 RepID=UPI002224635F|nr:DUF1345 domain-containing protein [Rhodoblastus acidophilus]MCW2284156.1 putative membrane protein [Rhodoblastus acidophilus]MCW2333001.1 putative membrane protein [Rhodoblastus acidophilus]
MNSEPGRRPPKILRLARARPRLLFSLALGVLVGFLLPGHWREVTRGLIGWNVGCWTYLVAAAVMIARSEHKDIHRRAALQDDGRNVVLVLTALAAACSYAAIFAHLLAIKGSAIEVKSLHIALAISTVVGSWLLVHLAFALHYAHEFYRTAREEAPGQWRGGISFPGEDRPDYPDFLYFSYVIGVACATADVNITGRPLRRLATAHCILAFFYNNAVLAMTINIGAGFVGG